MHYKMRKIFCTTALALVLGLMSADNVWAQGQIALADNSNEIPDEISLFGEESDDILLPPQKNNDLPDIGQKNEIQSSNQAIAEPSASAELPLNKPISDEVSDLSLNFEEQTDEPLFQPAPQNPAPIQIPSRDEIRNYDNNMSTPALNPIGGQIIEEIDDNVFAKMSDLEKQTAVLTLELRRERVKNEIEALKNVRAKAIEEEKARVEAEKRKQIEWEKEQEKKILQEQQKLRTLDIKYEDLRQEKLLNSYKNQMLDEQQKWIKSNVETYQEIEDLKKERQKIINDFKGKFTQLTQMADQTTSEAIKVRDNYAKVISDLQTQISILRARLEANEKTNPFADGANNSMPEEDISTKLSDLYAVMEIRGKGENLSAKLINDKGVPFVVRVGTSLQSGHVVDEISGTYVRATKDGNKDYLYFSAGGALEKEPVQNEELKIKVNETAPVKPAPRNVVSSNGIPGVAREMTIR